MQYKTGKTLLTNIPAMDNVSIVGVRLIGEVSELGSTEAAEGGRRLRVLRDGAPEWGRREGAGILLESGERLPEGEALYLAPVEPTKILAVHLTYRSRVEEYAARTPPQPSYFIKPPTTLNGHRGVLRRPRGTKFLNYEGELAVIVGRRMKGVAARGCSLLRRRLHVRQRRGVARLSGTRTGGPCYA